MSVPIVAISTSSFGKETSEQIDRIRTAGFQIRPNPHGRALTTDEAKHHLTDVVGLIAGTEKLTADLLKELPHLKVISRVGAGMDNVDIAAAKQLGIAVFNTPDSHVDAVAELTIGGLLAMLRGIPASEASIRAGSFSKPMGRLLRNSVVGLVGFGKVARAVARLLGPWNVKILAYDLNRDDNGAATVNARFVELDDLLRQSDIVSLHVPYSKSIHHLIGASRLALLKPDAILLNTARGGLIDENALHAHLQRNPKAGAYLDTFETEPYNGPLAKLHNVVLTAHIGSYAREARVRMEREAVDNLLRVLGT
ncbi:MAG: phosphoglycerate dehydrogenase [Kofleriaceae bacterium]